MVVASHHIGDLEHLATYRSFLQAVDHLCDLYDVRPEVVAHDLHPEYLSSQVRRRARPRHDRASSTTMPTSPRAWSSTAAPARCSALAFDGLGYGPDGTLWGGELLVADLGGLRPGRPPPPGDHAGWRRGHPGAVADGAVWTAAQHGRCGRHVRRSPGGDAVADLVGRPTRADHDEHRAGCSTPWRRCSAGGALSPTRRRPRSSSRRWPGRCHGPTHRRSTSTCPEPSGRGARPRPVAAVGGTARASTPGGSAVRRAGRRLPRGDRAGRGLVPPSRRP